MVEPAAPERFRRMRELFHAALDLGPEARADLLDRAGDPGLRREVESLLAAHDEAGGFLERPAFAAGLEAHGTSGDADGPDLSGPAPGERLGPWEILGEIGRGGMGAVYLARRADEQYEQRVAIKLVRRGAASPDFVRRFRHERQILAALDHPNIARLLDGGTTADGRPYLVMELVEGEPIDRWCERRGLAVTERLRLFRQVAAAVQHAHRSLVVHRDIKPGNILVTGDGTPKLLDFGIAKLLGDAGDEAPTVAVGLTAALAPMTPEYAAPEQILGGPITTATDVWALGALLYELLTGRRPFAAPTVAAVALAIRDREPERPSAAAPRPLARRLAGDLDAIVLKALRKEPERRYASAEQLAEDLRRHLEGLPVGARRETLGYVAGKLVRRHRASVAAAALAVLALAVGLAATLWQARVAERERARAERRFADVRRLANSLLFEVHDAIRDLPGATPSRELLVRRALEYLDGLAREAGADRELQRELAAAYERVGDVQGNPSGGNLGDSAGALASYEKALAIRRALAAADPADRQAVRDLAASRAKLGDVLWLTGRRTAALASYREALALREELAHGAAGAGDRLELARAHGAIGDLLLRTGDVAGGRASHERALAIAEDLAEGGAAEDEAARAAAESRVQLGMALARGGDTARAVESLRRALADWERLSAADPTDAVARRGVATTLGRLGLALRAGGDTAGALAHLRESLAISEAQAAADPANAEPRRDVFIALERLGETLLGAGDTAGALAAYRRGLEVAEAAVARDPGNDQARADLGIAQDGLGRALEQAGDLDGALAWARKALANEAALAADPGNAERRRNEAVGHTRVGRLLEATGDEAGALAAYRAALAITEGLAAADPGNAQVRRDLAVAHDDVGILLEATGDPAAAGRSYRRALALFRELAAADPGSAQARSDLMVELGRLGDFERAAGRPAAALARLREALVMAEELVAADPASADRRRAKADLLTSVGDVELARGEPRAARAAFERVRAVLEPLAAADPADQGLRLALALAWARLGRAHAALAEHAEEAERAEHRRRARAWYGMSLPVLRDLEARGALPAEESGRPAEVERQLVRLGEGRRRP